MLNYIIPIIVSGAIGLLLGWLSAVALKSAARALGCLVVLLFLAIQVLSYYGLIQWDWAAFFQNIRPLQHLASDAVGSSLHALTCNLPLSVGFLIGLLGGIRGSSAK